MLTSTSNDGGFEFDHAMRILLSLAYPPGVSHKLQKKTVSEVLAGLFKNGGTRECCCCVRRDHLPVSLGNFR
jgi:hypothetical protein